MAVTTPQWESLFAKRTRAEVGDGIAQVLAFLGVLLAVHAGGPGNRLDMLSRAIEARCLGHPTSLMIEMTSMMFSGVFDRFPKLDLILGHLGEALPFWMFRLDYMHRGTVMSKRYDFMKPLQKKISEYLQQNIYYTTSGMAWEPAISFTQSVIGMDRVMYAMDYPYEYVADEVRTQDALPISDADKKKFYQTTAERVFKL